VRSGLAIRPGKKLPRSGGFLRFLAQLVAHLDEPIGHAAVEDNSVATRREVAVTFGDRRRTEDRVYRFRIAYAWSQAPPSRTVRANRQCRGVHSERSEPKSVVP
jgi:3-phenylpropionate/cinnamic acid dioxygenase small subunit